MADDFANIRAALRATPAPEPRADFVEQALAKAAGAKPPAARGIRAAVRRPTTWWAAGIGALAATLAWMALMWAHSDTANEPSIALALNESRDVPLVIDAERDLEDATIRIYVTGSVTLAGYEQLHEVEWRASLRQGANLLTLPVVGRSPGDGRIVAEIEHDGRKRRMSVTTHVSALPNKGDTA